MYTSKNNDSGRERVKHAWALYRLQSIPPSKLATIINRILRGDDALINSLDRGIK